MHLRAARKMTERFGIGAALRETYQSVDYSPPDADLDDLLKQIK